MTIPRPILSALCIAAALLAPRAPARGAYMDPIGDTFGTGAVQIDVSSYDATYANGSTTFVINFAGAIAPPSAFAPNSVVGFIDLDLDRNAATGGTASFPGGSNIPGGNSWINYFVNQGTVPGPTIGLGDEAFVDLGSEANHPGTVDVIRTSDNTIIATVAVIYGAQSLTLTIPVVGTGTSQALAFGILVGTNAELTDRAANGSVPDFSTAAPVPEPTALALLGLGGAALGLGRARRRRGARIA